MHSGSFQLCLEWEAMWSSVLHPVPVCWLGHLFCIKATEILTGWPFCHYLIIDTASSNITYSRYNIYNRTLRCDFWCLLMGVPHMSCCIDSLKHIKRQKRNSHLTTCWKLGGSFMDSNNTDDLNDGHRQINEQSLTLHLKQRTLSVLLYNHHVHSFSLCLSVPLSLRLLCCQLSPRLYLHALCTWEIWDVAQLSIRGPVISCSSWLPGSTRRGLHVNMLIKIVKLSEPHSRGLFWLMTQAKQVAYCLFLVAYYLCFIYHNLHGSLHFDQIQTQLHVYKFLLKTTF